MNLVLFAHIPPPHHGQSYMVQLLLSALGGDARRSSQPARAEPESPRSFHVNARLSSDEKDVGAFGIGKIFRLLGYCAEAVYCRFRHRAPILFYVPSPPARVPLYRDWLVMLLCRPFFSHRVYYWQASGLGSWLQTDAKAWERWLTLRLLGRPDLSLILGPAGEQDAAILDSRHVAVTPNGIPDPCPDYEETLSPQRRARRGRWSANPAAETAANPAHEPAETWFTVLFLSLCTREKGLFDAIEAVRLLNQQYQVQGRRRRVRLIVAGTFPQRAEYEEFLRLVSAPELGARDRDGAPDPQAPPDDPRRLVRYVGFVSGRAKAELFRDCDCFCFPTFYRAESSPLALLEAMAHGMEVVATRWRNVPGILPLGHPGLVEPRSPQALAQALEKSMDSNSGDALRRRFLDHFTLERHAAAVQQALRDSVGAAMEGRSPQPAASPISHVDWSGSQGGTGKPPEPPPRLRSSG